MFRPIALDHLVLRVVDPQRMLPFYVEALGCTVERHQDDIGLVQLRAGSALIDLVPVDGKLGRAGGAAPGREGRTSTTSACASSPSTSAPSSPTWRATAMPRALWSGATAQKVKALRSTSATPKATWSNSRGHRMLAAEHLQGAETR